MMTAAFLAALAPAHGFVTDNKTVTTFDTTGCKDVANVKVSVDFTTSTSETAPSAYFKNLHRESKRLAHLVENVLSFARLTRGKVRGRQDTGPCRQILASALEKHAQRLRNAGFKVHINQDSRTDLLSLRTDLLSLDQILTNLTDNTIKYAAAVDAPAVNISTVRTHRDIAIRFADNGPGMQEEIRKRLFKPFSRSAQADRNRKPGIGLGLALSRDIARAIGGDLSLEKSTPQGTTFILTLPLDE